MKGYVLSFTGLFADSKEYVLAFNKFKNVLSTNNYVVAFNPWLRFSADIIDDMKLAKKRAVKTERSLIKEANPEVAFNAVIDNGGAKAKQITSNVQLPIYVEKFLFKAQARVDEEITKASYYGYANIQELTASIPMIIAEEAHNVKQEMAKTLLKRLDVKNDTLEALKRIGNAIVDEMGDEGLLLPYTALNTGMDLSKLVPKAGYRADSLEGPEKVKEILLGSQLNSQVQALVFKHIYQATKDLSDVAHLVKKDFIKMSPEQATQIVPPLGDGVISGMEKATLLYPGTGSVSFMDTATVVLTSDTNIQEEHTHATIVFGRGTDIFKGTDKATALKAGLTKVMQGAENGKYLSQFKTGSVFVIEQSARTLPAENPKPGQLEESRALLTSSVVDPLDTEEATVLNTAYVPTPGDLEESKVVMTKETSGAERTEEAKALNTKEVFAEDGMDQATVTYSSKSNYNGGDQAEANVIMTTEGMYNPIEEFIEALRKNEVSGYGINKSDGMTWYMVNYNGNIVGIDLAEIGETELEVDISFMHPVDEVQKEYEVSVFKVMLDNKETIDDDVELDKAITTNYESTLDVEVSTGTTGHFEELIVDTEIERQVAVTFDSTEDIEVRQSEVFKISDRVFDTQFEGMTLSVENKEFNVEVLHSEAGSSDMEHDVKLEHFERTKGMAVLALTEILQSEGFNPDSSSFIVNLEELEGGVFEGDEDVTLNYSEKAPLVTRLLDTDLDTESVKGHVERWEDLFIEAVEDSTFADKWEVTELQFFNGASGTGGDRDVKLEQVEGFRQEAAFRETVLQTVEGSATGNDLDVRMEELEESQVGTVFQETSLEVLEEIDPSTQFHETALVEVTEFKFDGGSKEVSLNEMTPYKYSAASKDTVLHELETSDVAMDTDVTVNETEFFERNVELPAIEHGMEDVENTLMPYDGVEHGDDIADKINRGGKMTIAEREESTPSEVSYDATLAEGELSDKLAGGEAVIREDEVAGKKASGKMTIADPDAGENVTEFNAELADQELAEQAASGEAHISDGDTATPGKGGKITISEPSTPDDLKPEYQAENTDQEEAEPIYNKVAEVREISSADRLRLLRGEVTMQDLGEPVEKPATEGDDDVGIGVIKPIPTEKKKIWSIMGKEYPAWNNWNPKKTR